MIVKIDKDIINTDLVRNIGEIFNVHYSSGYCTYAGRIRGCAFIITYSDSDKIRIYKTDKQELERIREKLIDYWTKGSSIIEIK